MEQIVGKYLLTLTLALISISSIGQHAQDMKGVSFFYEVNKDTGHGLALIELLRSNVPTSSNNPCSCSFGFFYFRVLTKNVVDSIYYEGTLSKVKETRIIENIKETNGGWKFPKGSNNSKKYWFVYPYFDFGVEVSNKNKCTDADREMRRNLLMIANNIDIMQTAQKTRNAIILYIGRQGERSDEF